MPEWSPDGSRIAFVSNRDQNNEIYVMNADGTGQTRPTVRRRADDFLPRWSPDGTRLLFWATRRNEPDQIYLMNADGTGRKRLTAGLHADW